jgi:hypothetical protein
MAKTAVKPKPKPGREIVKPKSGAVAPADLLKMMEGDAGKGVSTSADDNIVPLLYILQKGSPQCDRDDKAKYIKGAMPGNLWFRGTAAVIDVEDEPLLFIACYFGKRWIRWRANRGGYVDAYAKRPDDAKQVADAKNPDRMVWRMPNDKGEYNDACDAVVETREYAGLGRVGDKWLSVVFPFSSTGHTPAREWMGLINQKTVPGTDRPAPIFSHVYKVDTIRRENDEGSWYQARIIDAGEEDGKAVAQMVDDVELYKAARKIHADFSSGALKADVGEAGGEADDDNDM